jgi:hypothetical protein
MTEMPYNIDIRFCAIGGILIQWGFVEEFINDCVLILYHKYGGKNSKYCKKSGVPKTQFSRKLNFLIEIFESPALATHKNEGLSLISRAKELSKLRHEIIHGVIIELKPDTLTFSKHKYDKNDKIDNKPKLSRSEYSLQDLNNFGNEVQKLAFDLGPFVKRIVKEIC